MTEKRLIQGTYSTRRYLHSDEVFCKEQNWNINLPSEREFKNGYCIITDKEDTAYSIDELVDLLNELHEENQQLKKDNSLFKEIFNEMIRQTQVKIQPNNTKYSGTFIFTGEQFQLLRELMKED